MFLAFIAWLRKVDAFGTQISLKHEQETTYKTLGGGITTIVLRTLIFTYFCLLIVAVYTFEDPQISVHEIIEKKTSDESDPMKLEDYFSKLYFGFYDNVSLVPSILRPRFGKFIF